MITRRSLLRLLAVAPVGGALGALAVSSSSGARAASRGGSSASESTGPALHAGAPRTSSGTRKLVLVELQGGNDGLNTVVPVGDALYRKLRPSLGIDAAKALTIAREVALHPSLAKLAAIYEAGELAIVQGVGYARPVRSHFRSADIWHTGSSADETRTDGWIARMLEGRRGLLVAGDAGPLDGPGFAALAADGDKTTRRVERAPTNAALAHLARVHDDVKSARADIDRVVGDGASARALQGKAFVEQARLAARALADLDVAVIKLTLRGFDTHAGQAAAHARLLEELAEGLAELRTRAIADGTWSRTLVATTSEFGRRARENGSGGTDHGTAAPLFVLGGGIKGGVRGTAPRLDDLDTEGDIKMSTDFRAVLGGLAVGAWALAPDDVTRALGGVVPASFV